MSTRYPYRKTKLETFLNSRIMKLKTIIIACVALFATSSVMAQETKRAKMADMTREQRVEMKAQMVAKKLMLDDATKAKFLPMYVSYQNELYAALPAEVKEKMEARKEARKEMAEKRAENRKGQGRRGQGMKREGARGHGMMGECDVDGKTDAEVKAMVEGHFAVQQARLDISKKYFKKFSSVLTVKQSAAALKSAQGPHHHGKKDGRHGMKGHSSRGQKGQMGCRK